MLGGVEGVRLRRAHADDAHDAARGLERLEPHLGAGDVVGAGAGGRLVLVGPLRDGKVARVHVERRELSGALLQAAARVRHEDDDPPAEDLQQVAQGEIEKGVEPARRRELAAQRVERGGAALLGARALGRFPGARREVADDEADDEHDGEGDQVLRVAHGERQERRHEEEVEGRHAQHGGERGGDATEAHGHDHDAEQVDHDDVGELEAREHEPGEQRGREHGSDRGRVGQRPAARWAQTASPCRGGGAVAADHVDVDLAAAANERVDDRTEKHALPEAARRLADDDLADVARPGVGEDLVAHPRARERDRLGAQAVREAQRLQHPRAVVRAELAVRRRLDVDDDPRRLELRGEPASRPHETRRERARTDAHQHALGHRPHRPDGVLAAVALHLGVHALGGVAQRQLAQRDEIALAEEVVHRLRRLVRDVDLALLEAAAQVFGGQVHQLDLVSLLEHRVRHRLADDDAGDPGHDIVQRLEVLDIEGGVDVDTAIEQLEHVLPALGVAALRRVGVGQLVDEQQRRVSREGGVEVELLERGAAVLDPAARQDLEAVEQRLGFGALVRLDHARHDVDAGGALRARGLQHRVRLAHAGGGAEEDLQLAARPPRLLLADVRQKGIGIGPPLGHAAECTAATRPDCAASVWPGRPDAAILTGLLRRGGELAATSSSIPVPRVGRASASSIRPRFNRSQSSMSTEMVTTAASSSNNRAAPSGTDVSINPDRPHQRRSQRIQQPPCRLLLGRMDIHRAPPASIRRASWIKPP